MQFIKQLKSPPKMVSTEHWSAAIFHSLHSGLFIIIITHYTQACVPAAAAAAS
jgi:hypothetical protein